MQKAVTRTDNYAAKLADYLTQKGFECRSREVETKSYMINAIGSYSDVVNSSCHIVHFFPEQEKFEKNKVSYRLAGFGDCVSPNGLAASAQTTYEIIIDDSKVTVQISTGQLDIKSKRL